LRSCFLVGSDLCSRSHFELIALFQAYLCRVEGSTERGSITWRINLPDGRHVTSVSLRVASDTFDTGKVAWLLASDRRCDVIMPGAST